MTTIGVFAATRWELNAVLQAMTTCEARSVKGIRCWVGRKGDIRWLVVKTGIGPRKATAVCRRVVQNIRLSALISTGFACALHHARVGDVLVGTEVVGEKTAELGQPLPCAEEWISSAVQIAKEAHMGMLAGRFISVPKVLCHGDEKRAVAHNSGAVAVDMESAALAAVAREAGIPFAILRTVSDLMDEDLPLDFNLFLRPTGWIAGAMSCLSRPSSLAGLSRLRAQSRRAAEQLTRFHLRYLSALPVTAASVR